MSKEDKTFLEIVDLKKGFGSGDTRQEVLRGMNFSVSKGKFCVLLGPSGSEKSTLLNIIGGICIYRIFFQCRTDGHQRRTDFHCDYAA